MTALRGDVPHKAVTRPANRVTEDPILMAVMANRLDAIVREMMNTLLRTGRSTVISVARDFSCSVVTADNRLLSGADGLPVHVYGSHLLTQAMSQLHDDIREGDAFLHNDPYLGNTHAADHTILVPVFVDGQHLFTACAKAHQADCGNSLPTTYMPNARDVYEEGALIFPCVRVQRDNTDVDDIIRMCRSRIRVPDQWYGDYLAGLGAARTGEKRLREFVSKYGLDTTGQFVEAWFDYSERRMTAALRRMPSRRIRGAGALDPIPAVEEGVPLNVDVTIDSDAGRVVIDLRDNIDCLPAGINESEACSINNVMIGLLNVLEPDIPFNAGTFRRVEVKLRENCVVGIPRFPASTSVATSSVADRLINITQSALAALGDGHGLAQGGTSVPPGIGVISGRDRRRNNELYVNQLMLQSNGGPASPSADGWVNWGVPVIAGMMFRDSVEIDEQRYPILVRSIELQPDTGGAGRHRGAPAQRVVYGPRFDPLTVGYTTDGHTRPPTGVRGGGDANRAYAAKIDLEGVEHRLPPTSVEEIQVGEWVVGMTSGGGGYGDPRTRPPAAVLQDVREGWISIEHARDAYAVAVLGSDAATWTVDEQATAALRA
jgi:N-methylhydantoinase B